jgi:hypothetical protein
MSPDFGAFFVGAISVIFIVAWVNRFKCRVGAVTVQSGVFVVSANLVGAERKAGGTFMGTCFPGGSSVVGPTDDKKGTVHYIVPTPGWLQMFRSFTAT